MNEELKKEAEEAGDMHDKDCCMNTEGGCDSFIGTGECCENMQWVSDFIDRATFAERKRCAEIALRVSGVGHDYINEEEAKKVIVGEAIAKAIHCVG